MVNDFLFYLSFNFPLLIFWELKRCQHQNFWQAITLFNIFANVDVFNLKKGQSTDSFHYLQIPKSPSCVWTSHEPNVLQSTLLLRVCRHQQLLVAEITRFLCWWLIGALSLHDGDLKQWKSSWPADTREPLHLWSLKFPTASSQHWLSPPA